MFHLELAEDNKEEFPMRFTPLCRNENALGKARPLHSLRPSLPPVP